MLLRYLPDCTTARLEGRCSPDVWEAVDASLTYYEPGFRFSRAYKAGQWDGRRRLFQSSLGAFPAGLGARIEALLSQRGVPPEVQDDRPPPPWGAEIPQVPELHGVRLYSDQEAALAAFLARPRGCLCLPTGAGKTEIAAAVMLLTRPARALLIADRKSLVGQALDRLQLRLGERVGIYGGGRQQVDRRVTVATIQSLWHHRSRLLRAGFFAAQQTLVVDECHSISPRTWFRVLGMIPAPVRLGLSATIKEASRRLVVEAYLGPILHEQPVSELIDSGRAAQPSVYMLRTGGLVSDLDDPYVAGVVRNDRRNAQIVEVVRRCVAASLPTLVLVVRIEHGERLQRMLEYHGVQVPFLHGRSPLDDIDRAKSRLEEGRLPAIIASTIFDKGQDLPAIRVLVNGSGQRSPLLTIQRTGRALRRKLTGENRVTVVDFLDLSHTLLQRQAEARRSTYRGKGFQPKVVSGLEEILL